MTGDPNARSADFSTLPKFRGLVHECRDLISEHCVELLKRMLDHSDEIGADIVKRAESDVKRSLILEGIQSLKNQRTAIERDFHRAIRQGFEHFEQGKWGHDDQEISDRSFASLSLVDQDEIEIRVETTNIVTRAQSQFSEPLYALNHRLAVINGGNKIGENSAALPSSPAHLCEAFLGSIKSIEHSPDLRIPLLRSFQKFTIEQAGPIYNEFNSKLIDAEVLPNLALGLRSLRNESAQARKNAPSRTPDAHQTPSAYQKPARGAGSSNIDAGDSEQNHNTESNSKDQPASGDEALKTALFHGITHILAQRHHEKPNDSAAIGTERRGNIDSNASAATNFPELLDQLNQLQRGGLPSFARVEQDVQAIRDAFDTQIEKLREMLSEQQIATADADVIDLVGMLFEMILDDKLLPDSVKALLSHLHTPFLKIALLDRKFFVRARHPARRLLNAMSEAGSLCRDEDRLSLGIVTQMRDIVNRVLAEFNEDTELFSELVEEFNQFMKSYQQRSMLSEKRAIETAQGQEKLHRARRTVYREIANRIANQALPEFMESLLLGAWANSLVIIALRSGTESPEWESALETTDDLIASVNVNQSRDAQRALQIKFPTILDRVKAGLELVGDLNSEVQGILGKLSACHRDIFDKTDNTLEADLIKESNPDSSRLPIQEPHERAIRLKNIIPEEWRQALLEENVLDQNLAASPERNALINSLQELELGTWFEFYQQDKDLYHHAKLAWINHTTSNYMFVNHGGRQVAVKSLSELADDIERGRAKIVRTEQVPFMDRAMKSIQDLLSRESKTKDQPKPFRES